MFTKGAPVYGLGGPSWTPGRIARIPDFGGASSREKKQIPASRKKTRGPAAGKGAQFSGGEGGDKKAWLFRSVPRNEGDE